MKENSTFKELLAEVDNKPDKFLDMETGIVYSSIPKLMKARREKGIHRGKIRRISDIWLKETSIQLNYEENEKQSSIRTGCVFCP